MTSPNIDSEALRREREALDLAEAGPLMVAITAAGMGFTLSYTVLNWLYGDAVLAPALVTIAYALNITGYAVRKSLLHTAIGTAVITLFGSLAIQYFSGGVLASGVNGIWAMGAVLMSAVILGGRYVKQGMTAFVLCVAAELLLEIRWPPPPNHRPEWTWAVMAVINVALLGMLGAISLARFIKQRDDARIALSIENERSDELLKRILPDQVVARLKDSVSGTIAERLEATILFADLVGFTPMARREAPEKLVQLLDQLFGEFDAVVERYGLEKIKTIGDAYMAAGGVPLPRADHTEAVASLALDLQQLVRTFCEQRGVDLRVRIGVHTGPVVAGVIGRKRFTYDLWGDTVNLASRMESHGEPGEVQVTEEVYERLKDRFDFEPRGPVNVKGVGELKTWMLRGRRT